MSELEIPIAWRCSWELWEGYKPFDKSFRPKPDWRNYKTREAAEEQKKALRSRFGDQVVCCVSPVFISRASRTKKFDSHQTSVSGGWPLQGRPEAPR